VSIANYELAGIYGQAVYAPILRVVYPLSWTLGALVWIVALWDFEPGVVTNRQVRESKRETALPLAAQLTRFNNTLLKLLQR
jgi:hypothetical protein